MDFAETAGMFYDVVKEAVGWFIHFVFGGGKDIAHILLQVQNL